MTRIRFVTDAQGQQMAVPINLHWHGALLEDLWDGLLGNDAPYQTPGISIEEVRADLIKQGLLRDAAFVKAQRGPKQIQIKVRRDR